MGAASTKIASATADNSTRRLNEDYIVFRGDEHEAASAHLKGTLVLCLSEPLSIKHVKLHLKGMSRVWWVLSVSPSLSGTVSNALQLVFPVQFHGRWQEDLEGPVIPREDLAV